MAERADAADILGRVYVSVSSIESILIESVQGPTDGERLGVVRFTGFLAGSAVPAKAVVALSPEALGVLAEQIAGLREEA